MDTLLTEIIGFSGTAKGIPACEAGPQLHLYFSMLRNSYRGFSRMIADQDLAANEREKNESNCCDLIREQIHLSFSFSPCLCVSVVKIGLFSDFLRCRAITAISAIPSGLTPSLAPSIV